MYTNETIRREKKNEKKNCATLSIVSPLQQHNNSSRSYTAQLDHRKWFTKKKISMTSMKRKLYGYVSEVLGRIKMVFFSLFFLAQKLCQVIWIEQQKNTVLLNGKSVKRKFLDLSQFHFEHCPKAQSNSKKIISSRNRNFTRYFICRRFSTMFSSVFIRAI